MKPVSHVIFDMDGLLLDTEDLYTKAIQIVASKYGKTFTWEIKVQVMGAKGEVAAKVIIDSLDLPLSVEEYLEKVYEQYDHLFPTAQLLPDTVDIYRICHNKVLATYGQSVTWEELMNQMGNTNLEVAHCFVNKFSIPLSPEEYRGQVAAYYPEVFPLVKLMKGVEKLVRHLHAKKIPIAIASGGAQDSYELKTTNHKVFMGLFSHAVLASSDPDVKRGKPFPDVFLICAQRFPDNVETNKCLVFEDAPNGVAAGIAAGMQVVMVPDSRLDLSMTQGAVQVLSSLEDFQPELFGLPAYDS